MKRTKIPDMTPEQAMDELTMDELRKLLKKAKTAYEKAQAAEVAVFEALDDMCIDLEVKTGAENAENLGEAVACYLNYGEYDAKSLLAEIRAQYTKE